MSTKHFTKDESLFVYLLSLTLGVRQFATAFITIFVSIYAQKLKYGSVEIGAIALGTYGLLQALLQIPFGLLSDKFNKKLVLLFGLALLSLGLILSVVSNNAYVFVFSRALQGAGAFAAVGYSWLSISVEKDKVSTAMNAAGLYTAIGATVGLAGSTVLMMFMSYKTMTYIDIACVAITFILLVIFLKEPKSETSKVVKQEETELGAAFWSYFATLLKTKEFSIVNFQAFVGTYTIVAIFFIAPQYLLKMGDSSKLYIVFIPASIISTLFIKSSLKFVRARKTALILVISLVAMVIGILLFIWHSNVITLALGATIFMSGYNVLVTLFPTVTNHIVTKDHFRGTLNGVTNTFVFMGSFLGAIVTGFIWSAFSSNIALISLISINILALILGIYLLITSHILKEIK